MKIPGSQLGLIALSVAMSLLLWLWIGAQERSEIVVSVPLQYRDLPRGYEIVADKELVTDVNVWVRGTAANIKNLQPHEISAFVDLEGTKPGQKNFELEPDQVNVPYGFSVLRVSPSRIQLKIEEVVTRMVPVTLRTEGEPQMGYTVSESIIIPPQAEIIGPRSVVASVRHVITDSVDVSGVTGKYTETVNIGAENSAVRLGRTKEVRVTLTVSEIQDVITLRHVPVIVQGVERNYRFSPRVVRVDLLGPKNLLGEVTDDNLKAVVDAAGLNRGLYELTPKVELSEELQNKVSIKEVVPARINVRIL